MKILKRNEGANLVENGFTENKSGEQVEVKCESPDDVVECKLISTTKDECLKVGLITQTSA
jgi:hypothetical protein